MSLSGYLTWQGAYYQKIEASISFEQTEPDEPDFNFFYLGDGATARTDYNPAYDDYEPTQAAALEEVGYLFRPLTSAYGVVKRAASDLNLPPPIVYLVNLHAEFAEVAKYVNGTKQAILLDLPSHKNDPDEIVVTLLHELGHAYLDSAGLSSLDVTLDEDEEELVEEFARTFITDPKDAVEALDRIIEEYSEL